MALMPRALQDVHFELRLALRAKLQLEHLAATIMHNVEGVVRPATAHGQFTGTDDAKPRTHAGELSRDDFRIHNRSIVGGMVRHQTSGGPLG